MKIVVVVLLLLAQAVIGMESAVAEPTRFKDWTRECEPLPNGQPGCHIFFNAVNAATGQPMLRMEVGFIPGSEHALLLITVPLGVAIKSGLGFSIDDDKARPVDFYVCIADGCRAALPMDTTLIRTMKRGRKGQVAITELSGRVLNIGISLSGFTKAYKSIAG
jgi:invasion protein IalB